MAIELRAHPLIVAAALGLLGPAALADDDSDDGIAGVWTRDASEPDRSELRRHQLGSRIEVIPVEDRMVLDDGTGLAEDAGAWVRRDDGSAVQTLVVDGQRVEREFLVDGDALTVFTTVEDTDARQTWEETYTRSA